MLNPVAMFYTLGSYLIWGALPLYLGYLKRVPSGQVVLHRMLWSAVFMALVLALTRKQGGLPELKRATKQAPTLLLTAFLIGSNWFVYVYAIAHEHVLETSLGYFICPLVIVLLGRVVLKERWDRWQKVSISLASIGVLSLILRSQSLPIYAVYLALSFGLYALIRKRIEIPPVIASSWEMFVMAAIALVCFGKLAHEGTLFPVTDMEHYLLWGSGLVTALPLWWYNEGAKQLPLKTVGILQYLTPCLQFLIAILFFKEPFGWTEAIGFGFIWLAIGVYILRLFKRAHA